MSRTFAGLAARLGLHLSCLTQQLLGLTHVLLCRDPGARCGAIPLSVVWCAGIVVVAAVWAAWLFRHKAGRR